MKTAKVVILAIVVLSVSTFFVSADSTTLSVISEDGGSKQVTVAIAYSLTSAETGMLKLWGYDFDGAGYVLEKRPITKGSGTIQITTSFKRGRSFYSARYKATIDTD
jgi:hypothetical protein